MQNMTKNEAARFLGISLATLDRWRKMQLFPSKKLLNGHVVFDAQGLEDFARNKGEGSVRCRVILEALSKTKKEGAE